MTIAKRQMEEVKMIGSNAGEDFYKSGVIEDKIMERQWTLNDIINKEDIVSELARELISGMDIETKYFIVCDTEIPKGEMSFAKAIYNRTFDKLEEWITAKLSMYLKTATVNFNDEPIEALESFSEVVGCKALLTNPNKLFCSLHEYERGEDGVFSKRNVGRKSKEKFERSRKDCS